ncbi:DUF3626 domain-containing protein [Paenibacillus terrae]|nr:DUF3626 domain-containing protein [Paenibacillus terrae]
MKGYFSKKKYFWSDRGTYKEVLQELKLLWHVLVRVNGYGWTT